MIRINIVTRIGSAHGTFELKVDTEFQSNVVTRIIGPSGVGKTTLLKTLAGLIVPNDGFISVEDNIWYDQRSKYSKKIQERNVGFVFQDYALFPNMTVEEQLKYGTDDLEYIDELLEIGEMNSLKGRLPRALSGGQQQRLAILRALSTKPRLLLMDEPFSALDGELKVRLWNRLKVLFVKQKTTVLIVSHQNDESDEDRTYTLTSTATES